VFEIQTATWRDLKELHQLEAACFEKDAWPLFDLMAVLTFPSVVRLKAVINGKMVGFISGDIHKRSQVGWITTVGVLPDYRKRGIGTALLDACEKAMEQPRVRLCVRRSNLSAQNLYLHLGYRQVDIWKRYYSDSEDALVFEKPLNSPNER
jgi:ribosomal protein S18 acetylase RimI-like enzyme